MRTKQSNIENKMRADIDGKIEAASIMSTKEKNLLFEQCILINYFPKSLKEICALIYADKSVVTDKIKGIDRSIFFNAEYILKQVEYRFCFCLGATWEYRRFYSSKGHADIWKIVNNYVIDEFNGNILSVFCYKKDNEVLGTLRNLESLFTPKIDGDTINSMKAETLDQNWRNTSY